MALSSSQLLIFKAAIVADQDPAVIAALSSGSLGTIVQIYNTPAIPAHIVWRSRVPQDEIMQNGFDWTQVDNLSVGKARIWEWLFNNADRVFNPSKANVRAGIDATWVGTAQALAVRASVYAHCKRSATRAETLFASGAGSLATPSLLVFEGEINEVDVIRALES